MPMTPQEAVREAGAGQRQASAGSVPPALSSNSTRRRRIRLVAMTAGGLVAAACCMSPAVASMFGEENTTLVQMLVQSLRLNQQIAEVSTTVGKVARASQELMEDYQRVNAAINTIKNYTFDSFLVDVKTDLYNQYPGFAELELASHRLAHWDQTRASSPFTAYEALTAVVGDATAPLRADVAAGRANVDQELILAGEASGGFAIANTTEQVTKRFDRDIATLERLSRSASPGQAQQISARANLMLAAQNSYIMRLVARTVRLEATDAALQYAARMEEKNSAYGTRDLTMKFAAEAAQPPKLIQFGEEP